MGDCGKGSGTSGSRRVQLCMDLNKWPEVRVEDLLHAVDVRTCGVYEKGGLGAGHAQMATSEMM
jgi:hypothetical protein